MGKRISRILLAIIVIGAAVYSAGCGGGGGGGTSTSTGGGTTPVTSPPTITSVSATKTSVLTDEDVTITAAATSTSGLAITYRFSSTGGTLTKLSDTSYSFKTLSAGEFNITVTVTDTNSGLAERSIAITCFGSSASDGGVRGTISAPSGAARVQADSAPVTSENILSSPVTVAPQTSRDTSRRVSFLGKGAKSNYCDGTDFVRGELLLKADSGKPLSAIAAANGLKIKTESSGEFGVAGFDIDGLSDSEAALLTKEKCTALNDAAGVKYAALNNIARRLSTPNDPYYPYQWHYSMINLPQAWDITTGSTNVLVAVVDSGIVAANTELSSKTAYGYDFVSRNITIEGYTLNNSCDGDGPDSNPEDVSDSRCIGEIGMLCEPSGYHGTHVAGTIGAATNNGVGVAGINWNTKIMPVRVLGPCGGDDFDIIEGLKYASRIANTSGQLPPQAAKIVNISIGGTPGGGCPVQYQDIFDQMYNAGITVFVAAGNDGSNNGISPLAECDNVIAVGAVDESANRASYSNAGNGLSLVAPGGDTTHSKGNGVLSTVRNDSTSASTAYEYMQGTSMSSPHAAGVAALMLAANSSLSPLQIATILSQTSSDLGAAGTDIYYGAGLINAFKAVSEAKRLTGSSPDIPAGAVISLSSSNLYFNYGETSKTILITNTGATALSITSITDTENSGGNWMSLSSQSDSNRTALTVNINRTGLSAGEYHGYIQIQSNGGNSSIPVTIVAEGSGPSAPLNCSDSTLNAVAYGISSGSIVSSITFPYAVSTFNLLEVPAGSYRIYVTTDCDGDGSLCEAGDICGSYNSGATVAVTGKQYTSNININLTRQSSAVSAFKR